MDKDISPTYRLKSQIEDIFAQQIGLEAVVLLKDMRQFSAFV
ncbi:MAG: hypothetical protein ORN52_13115 [Beijerinckiaceae bacterium]|nr:hypothetical protein [Beijerinckiaceae bacterium]